LINLPVRKKSGSQREWKQFFTGLHPPRTEGGKIREKKGTYDGKKVQKFYSRAQLISEMEKLGEKGSLLLKLIEGKVALFIKNRGGSRKEY